MAKAVQNQNPLVGLSLNGILSSQTGFVWVMQHADRGFNHGNVEALVRIIVWYKLNKEYPRPAIPNFDAMCLACPLPGDKGFENNFDFEPYRKTLNSITFPDAYKDWLKDSYKNGEKGFLAKLYKDYINPRTSQELQINLGDELDGNWNRYFVRNDPLTIKDAANLLSATLSEIFRVLNHAGPKGSIFNNVPNNISAQIIKDIEALKNKDNDKKN